jgi:hypothetical protein
LQGPRQRALLYSAVMHRRTPVDRRIAIAGASMGFLAALLVGCVTDNRPATCNADETTLELTVSATALEPNDPAACRGQVVTMILGPEVDGIFHVHGLDTTVPATTVVAGEQVTLEFTADRSGQFPIEIHPGDDPQGVSIGIFTVYER